MKIWALIHRTNIKPGFSAHVSNLRIPMERQEAETGGPLGMDGLMDWPMQCIGKQAPLPQAR